MARRIGRWLHNLRGSTNSDDSRFAQADAPLSAPWLPATPSLPYLPQDRSRLTPSASRESLAASAEAAITKSGFFQLLPLELRRQILIEAFGNRTLHMDLRLDHPLRAAEDRQPGSSRGHGSYSAPLSGKTSARDTSAPREWLWWSCVCHRCFPPSWGIFVPPTYDHCLAGMKGTCNVWPGQMPEKCFIGVMGWLLSCRAAYMEGMSVLYGSNTISIESMELVNALLNQYGLSDHEQLLLRRQMEQINSLELRLDLLLFTDFQESRQLQDRKTLDNIAQKVPLSLPNLQKLYVSFSDNLYQGQRAPHTCFEKVDAVLLAPFDALVRRCGRLEHCVIELPTSIFRDLKDRAQRERLSIIDNEAVIQGLFWRSTNGSNEASSAVGDLATSRGYWVRSGTESAVHFDGNGNRKLHRLQPEAR